MQLEGQEFDGVGLAMLTVQNFDRDEIDELLAIKKLLEMASRNAREIGAEKVSEAIDRAELELASALGFAGVIPNRLS